MAFAFAGLGRRCWEAHEDLPFHAESLREALCACLAKCYAAVLEVRNIWLRNTRSFGQFRLVPSFCESVGADEFALFYSVYRCHTIKLP